MVTGHLGSSAPWLHWTRRKARVTAARGRLSSLLGGTDMRNLLAFAAAVVLAFLGLGWYLDWYKIQSVPGITPGQSSYNIEFHQQKITQDVQKGVQRGEQKLEQVMDKKGTDTSPPVAAPKATGEPSSGLQQTGGILPKVAKEVEEFHLSP